MMLTALAFSPLQQTHHDFSPEKQTLASGVALILCIVSAAEKKFNRRVVMRINQQWNKLFFSFSFSAFNQVFYAGYEGPL